MYICVNDCTFAYMDLHFKVEYSVCIQEKHTINSETYKHNEYPKLQNLISDNFYLAKKLGNTSLVMGREECSVSNVAV